MFEDRRCTLRDLRDKLTVSGFLCAVLFFFACVPTADAAEVDGLAIGRIEVAGNRILSDSEILSKVRSRQGDLFDPVRAAEDTHRIAELEGVDYSYYSTDVVEGKVNLTYVVVERNIVREIKFTGNKSINDKKLRKQLSTEKGDYLDAILAESGRQSLVDYYKKKGYAFVEISLDREQTGRGRLQYTIEEGSRVRIKDIDFEGNDSIKSSRLRNVIKTAERRFFILPRYYRREVVNQDVVRLQRAYYKKGYLDCSVESKLDFNDNKSRVRIIFEIKEGPVYKIDEIEFAGNEFFDDTRLQSEVKLQAGDVYSQAKAQTSVERIL